MEIIVSDEIRSICPSFIGMSIVADVVNVEFSEELWNEINDWGVKYKVEYNTETIKTIPSIAATRKVYRACGKDPSRYRPAGESLIRRILRNLTLYQIDNLVDLINLSSIAYGYSIGGFDVDKLEGETLTLGIGKEDEPYEGIGRGQINIAGMPVYRDKLGGFGTPTSDNERTRIDADTAKVLIIINGYDGDRENILSCVYFIQNLLRKYASSDGGRVTIF